MDTFGLRILASNRKAREGRCRQMTLPAPDGEFGILPGHENMIIAVRVGIATMVMENGDVLELALGNGFAEIINNRVTVLVDTAERADEIDARRAREQKERAEEQLRQQQSTQQHYHSEASLARAINRLKLTSLKH